MFATAALALAVALTPPTAPAFSPPACTSPLPAERLQGRWTGPFAGADWTFELTRDGSGWSGRYQSSKTQTWRPLEELAISGGCARFSLKSVPKLTFVLALDPEGAVLGGDIDVAGHATLPFAAKRVS